MNCKKRQKVCQEKVKKLYFNGHCAMPVNINLILLGVDVIS